jgi:ribosome-binding protein aMBF1 (putative translation factor)
MSAVAETNVIEQLEARVRDALPDGRQRDATTSMVEVARKAGIHVVSVRKFKSGALRLNPSTVERLANALGLHLTLA